MKPIIFPLKLRMQGPDVANLQAGLTLLGATIAPAEKTAQLYGATTQQAVSDFQKARQLPVTGTVDEAAASVINNMLAELGELDDQGNGDTPTPSEEPTLYSVGGEVVQPDGTPLPGHPVRAFDRALCDWRELVDTQVNEVRTDKVGRYGITYDPAQLKAWGKARADLKVEVYDPSGDVVLAASPLILQAFPDERVDFAIGDQLYRGPAEYTRVETALAPHLQSLDDLSCLGVPDVLILAREAKLQSSSVAYYVKAQRWAGDLEAPAALFYGLLRRNQPTRLDALLARPLARLWAALEEAKAQNIINLPLTDALRTRLADIQQRYLAKPGHPYTQLLNTTALSTAQQAVFTQKLTAGDLTGDAFWESLASDDDFSAEQVTDLKATFELQAFADANTSLTTHLRNALNVRAPREVAAFDVEEWRDTVLTGAGVELPDEILPGEAEPARRAAYAQMLYRSAELRYPTPSLAGQMARSPAWAEQPVSAFLKTYPNFEFGGERITYFLQEHPEVTDLFPDAQAAKAELLRVERLFHLTPPEDKLAVIQPMWDAGLRSAPQIAFLGRQHLLRLPGGLDRNVGTAIYRQAIHITSVALNVYLRYHPRLNSLSPYAVRTPQLPREQALAHAATALPEWEALFGSTDACECSHCESALSPAAYLVDSIAFLQRAVAVDGAGRNALDELLDRRPDLGTLQLTCENTETELLHIDLQNEITEAIVASSDGKTLSGGELRQTTWDSEHLDAQPEYLEPAAYEILREATYPFRQLPFDLWLEEGRRYLKQMGIARDELMRVMPPRPDVGSLEIATEALQMSTLESEIVRDPNTGDLVASWGIDPVTQLGHVETLLKQAKIDYATLLRLLNTRYVNADRLVVVTFTGDPCALDGAELTRGDGSELTDDEFHSFLDRLHRFLRLQHRLDCTEYELDTLLVALAVEDFNADGFLSKLADMQTLRSTLGLSLSELSSWWGLLDTYVFEVGLLSQYEAIFLDPSMFPEIHTGVGPDLRNDVFDLTDDRTDLAITTSTDTSLSRSLAESDGATPPTYTVQPEYSGYIQSATRLTAADLLLLVEEVLPKDAADGNVALNLANVSLLYRIASFVRAINSSVPDYLTVSRIIGISPLRTSTAAASPLDSMSFYNQFREINDGNWSIEQLAYLLLHDAEAAAVLAPIPENMDALQTELKAGYVGIVDTDTDTALEIAKDNTELNAALTQSLSSTLGLDVVLLDELLFAVRTNLGDDLLTNLIAAANTPADQLPPPIYPIFETLYKFSLAWKGLALDPSHLAFVLDQGPGLGWTDIAALPLAEQGATNFEAWRRLTEAADLQVSVFTVEEQSLFGLLQAASEAFDVDAFLVQISDWSSWNLADLQYLTGPSGFNLSLPDAMQDERPFVDLRQAFDLFQRTGVSAEQAHAWTIAELTFAETQSIKQALTLSYDPDSWLDVLAPIQDELRPLRRDALLGYLLHTLGFKDSSEFYHHYLIDPEQAACARTSRIVEAHAAVQIFAQRILFNLEPPFEFPAEDAEAWQWRKNYRVWEAARKVFLFPENWLEPEFRDNKSVFFKELEGGLSQDDINLTTAERLYHEYLYKLGQVSRLEIMGMYEDTWMVNGDMETNVLHVFGRTRDIPHLYYYRRWEDQARWTPWERVGLDIEGDHLIPIVYNGRLYLFWAEFKETHIEDGVTYTYTPKQQLIDDIADFTAAIQGVEKELSDDWNTPVVDQLTLDMLEDPNIKLDDILRELLESWIELDGQLTQKKNDLKALEEAEGQTVDQPLYKIELGIAWSQYQAGTWSAKTLGGEKRTYDADFPSSKHFFTGWVSDTNQLRLAVHTVTGERAESGEGPIEGNVGYFYLDECQGGLLFSSADAPYPQGDVYVSGSYQLFHSWDLFIADALSLEVGRDNLATPRSILRTVPVGAVNVQFAHQYGLGGNETSSFFYTDDKRTYFVQPLPEVYVGPGTHVLGPTQRRAGGAARIAPLTGQMGLATSTHYQGTNVGQIIDRGFTEMSPGTLTAHSSWLDTIIAEDPPPTFVAGEIALTGFRYRFTRFYHPYTCLCIKQLSRHGVEGLLNPVRGLDEDSENLYRQGTPLATFDFENTYFPNSEWVLRNYHTEEIEETIDFDHNSPYGCYNWELFFHIPLLIATRLMQNQRFAEARRWFHYIFNPTWTDGEGPERFWKIKPFYEAQLNGPTETLQELIDLLEKGNTSLEQQVQEWEKDPFNVHAIARLRITAYMQTTVRKYLDCLIKEADMLFMRETREYINEAVQLYLLAAEILGERPTLLPAQEAALLTPNILLDRYRDILGPGFSFDVLDHLTSMVSTSLSGVPSSRSGFRMAAIDVAGPQSVESGALFPKETTATSAQGGTDTFNTLTLFCIPHNDLLYGYWNTVADRLFKIRHCMNISGQVRQLALFAPPIDPALLVRATAAGLDIGEIVSGLYASLPNYRFNFMLQKALELCGEVRSLGGALLAALEKKDGEELSLLRSTHEVSLLESIRALKQKNIDETDASLAGLLKSKESAEFRAEYYSSLERVSSGEQKSLDKQEESRHRQRDAEIAENIATGLHLVPTTGVVPAFGGPHLGSAAQAFASVFRARSAFFAYEANKAGTMAGYDRRLQDWTFQADLAKKEIEQLDKQILAAEIRKQIAEADLKNHDKQIAQAEEVEEFLKMKFTNQDLYSWIVSQISGIYFTSYQMAYNLAMCAEKAYRHELGVETSDFIQFGNWDSLKKGLLSGEKLTYDLRRMETAYLEANLREFEITKPISLFQLDPAALLTLRQTGTCDIHIPELLFDLDFPGHYFRRIKAVRITIPGIAGPYTNVSATLRLAQSWTRREVPADLSVALPEPESDATVLPQTAIATSNCNGDSGMFELSFNDPRYLPFEGAGAISTWQLELPTALRPFDYAAIADVVMHMSYTAREAGDLFKDTVNNNLVTALNDWKKLISAGVTLSRLFSLRHEFPVEFNRLVYPAEGQAPVTLKLSKQHFPRYLDFLWWKDDARLEPPLPISISFSDWEVILDPIGLPDPPTITVSGLSDITNDEGADVEISVSPDVLEADRWRDIYLLLHYEVSA